MARWTDESRLPELMAICRRFGVNRLEVFGSAASGRFDPSLSDVDLLVELQAISPVEYAANYFGLLEALEGLLQRPVDLVTVSEVANPHFRESVDSSRRLVYAA